MRAWVRNFLVAACVLGGAAEAFAQQPLPRTAEGHPDLQGVWTSRWLTPLERPATAKTVVIAPEDVALLAKAEWARHNAIDPIEGTDSFEYTTFVTVRGETRSALIVDPPDGRLPFTEQGRARQPAGRVVTGVDGPEQRALNERCLNSGNGAAPYVAAPSGNIRRIVQTHSDIVIHTELLSILRIIPVDGRTEIGFRNEHTTGRWDGDTLVVTTTDILDPVRGARGSLFPLTPKTKITERFTRTAPGEILYTFTVEDPQLYSQPWKGESIMALSDDRMFEFACHEGNYGLANILSGARAVERRAARKAKP